MLEKLRQLIHPSPRKRIIHHSGSQVVIFAPRSTEVEQMLFPWLRNIKGVVTSELGLLDHLISDETKALIFYGEPPKIGNIDLLSDEVVPLLRQKLIYQLAGQSPDAVPRTLASYVGTGYLGYREPYAVPFRSKAEEALFRGVALSGVTSLLDGNKLSTVYEAIKKKSIESTEYARKAKFDNGFLLTLWLHHNLSSLYLWGDPDLHIQKYSKLILVNTEIGHLTKRRVEVVDITSVAVQWLKEDPNRLEKISPEEFEDFVADRLQAMKFVVKKVGSTYARDGGIDLIAWPESAPFPFLIAVQIKHHKKGKPVGPSVIREFRGVIEHQPFDIGLIVTNTRFTPNAEWVANQIPSIVRLRDFQALRKWLYDEFDNEVWKEIPNSLQLAPDVRITLPNILRREP